MHVSLKEFIETMDMVGDLSSAYLNTITGKMEVLTMDEMAIESAESGIWGEPKDWEKEQIAMAKEVLFSGDWEAMPDPHEINDYKIMRDYCFSVENERIQDELLDAIRGRGAFRRFRDLVNHYNLLDDWYSFKYEAYKYVATGWLDFYEIPYEDDTATSPR